MKPKQLANVLIRILGLSMIAHSVSPILNLVFGVLTAPSGYGASSCRSGFWYFLAVGVVPAAISVVLIEQSRLVTEKPFKDEAE
jgi:hypothetical protein